MSDSQKKEREFTADKILSEAARVTLRDIARASKLSVSGVSMAMRNDPSIPTATCVRVQHLAQKMGYRPNPYVSALMHSRAAKQEKKDPFIASIAYINHSESFVLEQDRSQLDQRARSYKSNIRDFYLGASKRAQKQG